jgi:hypothetical protein
VAPTEMEECLSEGSIFLLSPEGTPVKREYPPEPAHPISDVASLASKYEDLLFNQDAMPLMSPSS